MWHLTLLSYIQQQHINIYKIKINYTIDSKCTTLFFEVNRADRNTIANDLIQRAGIKFRWNICYKSPCRSIFPASLQTLRRHWLKQIRNALEVLLEDKRNFFLITCNYISSFVHIMLKHVSWNRNSLLNVETKKLTNGRKCIDLHSTEYNTKHSHKVEHLQRKWKGCLYYRNSFPPFYLFWTQKWLYNQIQVTNMGFFCVF